VPLPDITINAKASFSFDGFRDITTLTLTVANVRTCGTPNGPGASGVTFGVTVPEPLRYCYAQRGPHVASVSEPTQGSESGGVAMFRSTDPIPSQGAAFVAIVVESSENEAFELHAFSSTTDVECNLYNNNKTFYVTPSVEIFSEGSRALKIVLPSFLTDPSSPSFPNDPPLISLIDNAAPGGSPMGGSSHKTAGLLGFNVYTSTQPNVRPVEGNLFTSVGPTQLGVDVSGTPAGSFFVVTTVTDAGEGPPSNEVGGVLPTVTKLKVSASKIVAEGTGFAPGLQVFFSGLPFATAAKLKKANTKVVQKGVLATGESTTSFADHFFDPGSKVIIFFVNANGNGVAVEYTR
jgi:hypothetical protein